MGTEEVFFTSIFLLASYGLSSFFAGNNNIVVHFVNDKWVWIYANPYSRVTLYTYLGFTLLSFSAATYNDGKKALMDHRNKNGDEDEDFKVTIRGCKYNMGDNLWDSVIFPWHLVANVFPYAVLRLNPRKEPPSSPKLFTESDIRNDRNNK